MTGWTLVLPELLLGVAALAALFLDSPSRSSRLAAWVGAGAAAVAAAVAIVGPHSGTLFGGMLVYDGAGAVARAAIAGLTAVWCLWVAGRGLPGRTGPGVALALFAATGGLLLVAAADLITLFLAIEIATMPAYVLVGYDTSDERSIEGALKYFLLSVLTSLVLLYGLSLLYGISGSTAYADIGLARAGTLGLVAALLVVVGLLAKLSAAPFHFWAPDAYEGAPAASVAFVSTVPKVAGVVALARLIGPLASASPALTTVILVISVISMLLGNLAAYPQADLRRLMAYSGIAHVGYLLLGISAGTRQGLLFAIFYAVVYSIPSMGVMLIGAETGNGLARLAGLAKRVPWLAWTMTVFALSLIGVPPLAGFFGKLFLFTAAFDGGQVVGVVIAVIMSVVSAGYYFRIVRPMFFDDPPAPGADVSEPAEPSARGLAPGRSLPASVAVVVLLAFTVFLGLASAPVIDRLLGG